VILLESLAVLDDAATGFERQRAEVVALLEPASTALDRAATSASNAGASLAATRDAAAQAAQLTSRLADSYDGLAALGSFDLLGTRPFAVLAGQFAAVATEARTVSADLGVTAASMNTNVTDSAAVAADLHARRAGVRAACRAGAIHGWSARSLGRIPGARRCARRAPRVARVAGRARAHQSLVGQPSRPTRRLTRRPNLPVDMIRGSMHIDINRR
jgi:hypothetical protein